MNSGRDKEIRPKEHLYHGLLTLSPAHVHQFLRLQKTFHKNRQHETGGFYLCFLLLFLYTDESSVFLFSTYFLPIRLQVFTSVISTVTSCPLFMPSPVKFTVLAERVLPVQT